MNMRPREMVATGDVYRSMGAYLDRLKNGDLDKLVIVRTHGRRIPEPIGVVLTPERYEQLLAAAAGAYV